MNLKKISESDFKKLDVSTLFENAPTDRAFGIVSNGVKEYKFGWQSTDIEPLLVFIHGTLWAIGVDLIFVVFDINKGEVLLRLALDYFLYDVKVYNGVMYVATELEVIKINISDLLVTKVYPLPDYFESIEFKDGVTSVKCLSGDAIKIE